MFTSTKDLDEKYTNSNNQVKTDKSKSVNGVVCSFWLKNACKYGSSCKYLHEDIPEKYPECEHGINCTKINSGCPFNIQKNLKKNVIIIMLDIVHMESSVKICTMSKIYVLIIY